MIPIFPLKVRTVSVGVVACTPQACSHTFALCADMIRRPFLASETLIHINTTIPLGLIMRSNTSVMLKAQKNPLPQDSPLSFLIFKGDYYFVRSGPCFFIQKTRHPGQFEIISLFKLSFENAIF